MYLQSIVKHFLTQGDSMILAAFSSLEDQAIYGLASNYGGLVARMLFQPIEESCRNIWTGQLNTTDKENRSHKTYIEAAKSQLVNVLRTYSIFAILALSIGPSTIPIFLRFLIGSHWMSPKVQELLSTYCCYIPFLAFNGVTEAFVSASASASDMRQHAVWMSVFSACFCLVSFLLLNIAGSGAVGLVWANVINMSIRTIWSFFYIRNYLRQNNSDLEISEFSPQLQTFGVLVLAASWRAVEPSPSYDDLFYNIFVLGFAAVCGVLT
jgi:oligosaccharide translocation protein RFT1